MRKWASESLGAGCAWAWYFGKRSTAPGLPLLLVDSHSRVGRLAYIVGRMTEERSPGMDTQHMLVEGVPAADSPEGRYRGEVVRVRIDATGPSAGDVEWRLLKTATEVDGLLGTVECAYGEQVIERQVSEAPGSPYAWKGRILIYPSIGREPFVPVQKIRDAVDA